MKTPEDSEQYIHSNNDDFNLSNNDVLYCDEHSMEDDDMDLVIRFFEETADANKLANHCGIDVTEVDEDGELPGCESPQFLMQLGIDYIFFVRRSDTVTEVGMSFSGKVDDFDKMLSIARGVTLLLRSTCGFHFPNLKMAHPSHSFDDM
jgi:hypothetical protein